MNLVLQIYQILTAFLRKKIMYFVRVYFNSNILISMDIFRSFQNSHFKPEVFTEYISFDTICIEFLENSVYSLQYVETELMVRHNKLLV